MIRPRCCEREIRSVAYSPASTNSTHEARTAGSLEALTSKALSQAGGTRFSRSAYCAGRQHVADFDLHALAKDLADLVQPVAVDVLLEHRADGLGHDRIEHLPLGHLVAAHHVELELAQRRRIDVPQVADPRHGRPFAQLRAALPGAGHHRAIVGDPEPALTPDW